MTPSTTSKLQKTLSVFAFIFGVVTVSIGTLTLTGHSDPGYNVFTPLLIFNTIMGLFYLLAGYILWQNLQRGKKAAGIITIINLLSLLVIVSGYQFDVAIAFESLMAMTFRTVVWGIIYFIGRSISGTDPNGE